MTIYFILKMATCFSLTDHHQAIITKILKMRRNAGQIKLVIWEPTWLTKFIENYIKSLVWFLIS